MTKNIEFAINFVIMNLKKYIQVNRGELKEDDLRGIFTDFDLNGDGYIQKDELKSVMIKMGQCPTDEELDAMFSAADKDKDGNIDFNGNNFVDEKKNF